MHTPSLTIFTPTYNRAHTLKRLFDSLKYQTNKSFEWLVIDDGSTDETHLLFQEWMESDHGFIIKYEKIENGGKNRAVNKGIQSAEGRYFMILDSDDMLTTDAVDFICKRMPDIEDKENFIGLSGKRADITTRLPIGFKGSAYSEEGFIDCTNLQRKEYDLSHDMAEVFITKKLKRYKFEVWTGEKFTPEEVVWNQMALDGLKLRWYNKIIYLCEYQQGGLSDSTWSLLKNNPMGYAMMWNQRIVLSSGLKKRIKAALQYNVCCILAKEWKECLNCNSLLLGISLLPISYILAIRRKVQIANNLKC